MAFTGCIPTREMGKYEKSLSRIEETWISFWAGAELRPDLRRWGPSKVCGSSLSQLSDMLYPLRPDPGPAQMTGQGEDGLGGCEGTEEVPSSGVKGCGALT